MKLLLSLVLVFGLGFSAAGQAAAIPFSSPVSSSEGTETVAAPRAANLQPNWWRYFETRGEELGRRIQQTLARLAGVVQDLPRDEANAARPLLVRLRVNLEALPDARGKPSPEPPPPLVTAPSYTLEELLAIARRSRAVQGDLAAERDEVSAAVQGIDAAMQRIDTHMAAYLELAPTDPDRFVCGLEIMADRAAVAVARERLRVRRATLAALGQRAEQLVEEQRVASQRLIGEPDDLSRLDRRVEQAQNILDQARQELIRERAGALTVEADDPQGRAKAQYQQHRVIRAAVAEAIAQMRLLRFQAQRGLLALLLDTAAMDRAELRDRLTGWEARLVDIRRRIPDWTRDSQRELERARELVAGAAGDIDIIRSLETVALKVLNQDRMELAQDILVALERLRDAVVQTRTVLQVVDLHLVSREGELGRWLARGERWLTRLWQEITQRTAASLFRIGDTPVTALGLLRVAVILFLAWWVSALLRRALARLGESHQGINQSALYTITRLSHYAILIVGVMVGLASIGIDFTNFAIVAGAMGIGIGFGLQSIVSNFVSGLIMLFERHMKVGDFVELDSGLAGEVREINVRSTLINTNDNVDVVVPNSEFINRQVINWTLLQDFRRIHVAFKVALDADPDRVEAAALEAAEAVPHTLRERKSGVWLVNFGDSGLEFELVVWVTPAAVKRPGATEAAYKRAIAMALRRHGIEVPLPQRDLRLRSGFERLLQPPHTEAGSAEGAAAPGHPWDR